MPDTAAPAAGPQPVGVRAAGTPLAGLGTLAVGVIAIAALYFGREVFIPTDIRQIPAVSGPGSFL